MRRSSICAVLASLLMLLAVFVPAIHAKEMSVIDSLPAYAGAREIKPGEYDAASSALTKALTGYLHGTYRVEQARFFVIDPKDATWIALDHFANEHLQSVNARRETFNWHRAGYDLYSVWSLNEAWTMHVAVAMTHEPLADGRLLIGYFALSSS